MEKEEIIELLKKHPEGLTIADMAKKLSSTRNTVTKYLHELIGENKLRVRKLGPAKMHYLK